MDRCNLNVSVMPTWWQDQLGRPIPETEEERFAVLEELFPGLITYRQQAAPAAVPDPNHGYTMFMALGASIRETSIGSYEIVPMAYEQLMEMTPPDYATSEPVQVLRKAIRETRAKHGSATNGGAAGLFTIALWLRGHEIFTDFFERPEEVKQWVMVFTEALHSHLKFQKDECGEIRYFGLGSCSNCMISPDIYEGFFREGEARIASLSTYMTGRPRQLIMHHCGTKVDAYMDSYSRIPELGTMEADWQSDLDLGEKKMPGLIFKPMLDPILIDDMPEDEIERVVIRFLERESVGEIQSFALTQHTTVSKIRRMLTATVEYNTKHGLPGYTRWFV